MVGRCRSNEVRTRTRRALEVGASAIVLVLLAVGCINNGTWTAVPAPTAPLPGIETRLHDVSCVSEDWCLAVGFAGLDPMARIWDGMQWSAVTAPSLVGQPRVNPVRVECGTPTSCVVELNRPLPLGSPRLDPGAGPDVARYLVAWNGAGWLQATGEQSALADALPFSCAPDGTCLIADGEIGNTVVWDGDSVTTIPFSTTQPPGAVNAIDCRGAGQCVAATTGPIARWDGTTWSELPGSDTSGVFTDGPHSIECVTTIRCLAAGPGASGTGPTSATWDGSTWSEVELPAGVTGVGTIECAAATECLVPVTGGSVPLIAWNGSGWYDAPSPPTGVGAMSCRPGWCLGVGFTGSPATPVAATYVWTNP